MNKQSLFSAFNAYVAGSQTLVETLRKATLAAGFKTLEETKPVILEWASKKYGVPLGESKSPRNKGEMVLDRAAEKFEAAKKAAQRLMEALGGNADAQAKPASNKAGEGVEIPAHIAALAAKLAAACLEYEQSKKLAAQAVAEAFAAK